MSKELEALGRVKDTIKQLDYGFISKEDSEDFQIIETTLKEYNEIEIENRNLLLENRLLNQIIKTKEHDLKVLEIIKEYVGVNCLIEIILGSDCPKEKMDLLKEVLL